jgi:lysophospholipase L1-like esterase
MGIRSNLSIPRVTLLFTISLLSFSAGILSQWAGLPRAVLQAITPSPRNTDPIAPPTWREPFVLVVAGQSNAANHGHPRARASSGTYAISVNGLFRLEDPLPGASGPGGSPWPHWAAQRQLVQPGRQVVVAAIAQGSSAVTDWIDAGVHAQRLPRLQAALRLEGLEVDAVLWHQGETEAWSGADPSTYATALRRWIASVRALGITAPIYVCLTSRDSQGVINPAIRQAQASVWNRAAGVFAGPDTDSLGSAYRSDGVHFNQQGLEAVASLLERAMASPSDRQAPTLAEISTGTRVHHD